MPAIKIEVCNKKMVGKLIKFIDLFWKKDHIFTQSRELFDWQHKAKNGNYNFILAVSTDTEEILGVLGFITTQHFSGISLNHNEAWLAIWRVRDDVKVPGVGVSMLNFLRKKFNIDTFCGFGMNQLVIPLYKALKFTVSTLDHSVLINQNISDFSVLKCGDWKAVQKKFIPTNYDLELQNTNSLLNARTFLDATVFVSAPMKNVEYIINRYLKHPTYSYKVHAVAKRGATVGLLVTRIITVNGIQIIRVIDYQGEFDHFSQLNQPLKKLLHETKAEYIDFMQYGMPRDILKNAGFVDIYSISNMVVPNYFEPFLHDNVVIDCAYKIKNKGQPFFICKGDSDQDRPNEVRALSSEAR